MSCAGQIMPPEGYFKQVYKHCRDNGTLCIADEVQVGFGRVGSHMWAYEVIPYNKALNFKAVLRETINYS